MQDCAHQTLGAWQDDASLSLDTMCGTEENEEIPTLVQFMGKCENKNTDKIMSGVTGDMVVSWHPGPAWIFTFMVIPSLAFLQHICFLIPMAGTGWLVLFIQFLNSIKAKNSEQSCPD